MPTIVRPASTPGHEPEAAYHVASVPLDAALGNASVAVVLDVEKLQAMSGSSNISSLVSSLLRQIEGVILAGKLQ